MTLYEILSLTTPFFLAIIGYFLTRLNYKMDKFDDRLSHVERELYFVKGLLEGKKSLD